MVATETADELQVPPLTVDVNGVVPATQISCGPLNNPAEGGVVTVTILVADTSAHPPVPVTV